MTAKRPALCSDDSGHKNKVLFLTTNNRHGAQGELDTASKASLENEFGTSNEDEVVKKILTDGSIQTSQVRSL